MAQIKDVLEIEYKREVIDDYLVVHLFEGGTFYRAYQWSAWLCHRYIKEFKATRRKLKQEDDTLVFVGFPINSLMNYISSENQLINVSEKQIDILLPHSVFEYYADVDKIKFDYSNWKESVPLSESSKKKSSETLLQYKDINFITAEEILKEIACFPIEQKTMLESIVFLSQLKQKVLNIITKT